MTNQNLTFNSGNKTNLCIWFWKRDLSHKMHLNIGKRQVSWCFCRRGDGRSWWAANDLDGGSSVEPTHREPQARRANLASHIGNTYKCENQSTNGRVCFDPREAAKDREGGFRALDLKESFSPTQPPYCSILNFAFPGKIYAMTTQKDKESKSNIGQHFQLMHYLTCSSFN